MGADLILLRKTELCRASSLLRLKPLRAAFSELFCELYNEIFCAVPHALVMDEEAVTSLLLDTEKRAGFLMRGGEPVGVFALDLSGETPVIMAVGLLPACRGLGLGREALKSIEIDLSLQGYSSVQLFCDKGNAAALALYRKCGYN